MTDSTGGASTGASPTAPIAGGDGERVGLECIVERVRLGVGGDAAASPALAAMATCRRRRSAPADRTACRARSDRRAPAASRATASAPGSASSSIGSARPRRGLGKDDRRRERAPRDRCRAHRSASAVAAPAACRACDCGASARRPARAVRARSASITAAIRADQVVRAQLVAALAVEAIPALAAGGDVARRRCRRSRPGARSG